MWRKDHFHFSAKKDGITNITEGICKLFQFFIPIPCPPINITVWAAHIPKKTQENCCSFFCSISFFDKNYYLFILMIKKIGMENEFTIAVIMDHREKNESLKKALLSEQDVNLKIDTLKAGDFLINDSLLVERKTFCDFVSSIKDGRIFTQAFRLTCSGKHTLIILEGTSQDLQTTGMSREAIQGALICLSLKFCIPVLRSMSPEETVKLMISSYKQIANVGAARKHLPQRPVAYRRSNKLKQQVLVLQGLQGIGPARAKILLDKFGTLQAIFSARVADLIELEGVGTHIAEKIYFIANDGFQPYSANNLSQFINFEKT